MKVALKLFVDLNTVHYLISDYEMQDFFKGSLEIAWNFVVAQVYKPCTAVIIKCRTAQLLLFILHWENDRSWLI